MNTVANIGHNSQPGQAQIARDVFNELTQWMDVHPVIVTHEEAKAAAQMIKRARIALQELDEERERKVRPLNDTVKAVNGAFKVVSEPLTKVVKVLKANLKDHLEAEEARRVADALKKYQEAQAAVEELKRAQEAERQAIDDAKEGVVGTKVGELVEKTNEAFVAVERANRAAQIADKDSIARVSPGFGRTMSMRNVEVLSVDDPLAAVNVLWARFKDEIAPGIIRAAKDFRKLYEKLPPGVRAETERKL